jgi:hypothetical protein
MIFEGEAVGIWIGERDLHLVQGWAGKHSVTGLRAEVSGVRMQHGPSEGYGAFAGWVWVYRLQTLDYRLYRMA